MSAAAGLQRALFRASQVRELDRAAIDDEGIPGAELMERAGVAAFHLIRRRWPEARRILVVCGQGNNAGDAYVVARHGREAGLDVGVAQLGEVEKLSGDALGAYQNMRTTGLESAEFVPASLSGRDLVIDGLFGTGLSRPVTGPFLDAIECINASSLPVLALDVPSGSIRILVGYMVTPSRPMSRSASWVSSRVCLPVGGPAVVGKSCSMTWVSRGVFTKARHPAVGLPSATNG